MYRFIVFLFVLALSAQSFAFSKKIESVELYIDASAILEVPEEFENNYIQWLPEEEYSREAKGQVVVTVGEMVELGPISIKVTKDKVSVMYGYNSSMSLSPSSSCESECSQDFTFSYDDGDYPVSGKITATFYLSN